MATSATGSGAGDETPSEQASRWQKLWARCAAPSGVIGLLGLLLLFAAFGVTTVHAFLGRVATPCTIGTPDWASAPAKDADRFRIVRVDPDEWQFSKRVCVVVENVVSAAQLQKLRQAVTDAETAVTKSPIPERAAARAEYVSAQSALTSFTKGFEYRLYVNGQPSTLTAHAAAKAEAQPLSFTVKPDDDAASVSGTFWRDILAQPSNQGRVPIEIGLAPAEAAAPADSTSKIATKDGKDRPITFLLYEPLVMGLALAGIACVTIGLVGLSYQTPLLRAGDTNMTAYSLSRVQIAFWLILSTAGFVYVWMVTGQYLNVFPPALFVLIGISGATAGAAQLVDTKKTAPLSENFLHDIAGDWKGGQVQLPRLQIIAWTIILGLIFCWNVVANLKLVSFDTNLLLLAGVANGVYLTMKTQE